MNKEEIEKKIEDLEDKLFLIDMIDRWEEKDREAYSKYSKELRQYKELLKGVMEDDSEKSN